MVSTTVMGLNKVDLLIIAIYLAGITLFGLRFRKRQRSLKDYFLADRNIPWWAIALSIVAAETSTLTIISIPGLAYDTNLQFLQVVLGYLVGRVIISFILLPHYFRGDLYTAYQLIESRFGGRLRSLTAGLFLQEFVPEKTAWAHLDIAGPFIREKEWKYYEAGAIGFGLKTLVDVAERFNEYGL